MLRVYLPWLCDSQLDEKCDHSLLLSFLFAVNRLLDIIHSIHQVRYVDGTNWAMYIRFTLSQANFVLILILSVV